MFQYDILVDPKFTSIIYKPLYDDESRTINLNLIIKNFTWSAHYAERQKAAKIKAHILLGNTLIYACLKYLKTTLNRLFENSSAAVVAFILIYYPPLDDTERILSQVTARNKSSISFQHWSVVIPKWVNPGVKSHLQHESPMCIERSRRVELS